MAVHRLKLLRMINNDRYRKQHPDSNYSNRNNTDCCIQFEVEFLACYTHFSDCT